MSPELEQEGLALIAERDALQIEAVAAAEVARRQAAFLEERRNDLMRRFLDWRRRAGRELARLN
jgi:hypothetical protein